MFLTNIDPFCYGPSVISVTVTKGGHPRGGRLYKASKTMGRGVAESRSQLSTWKRGNVETWERATYRHTDVLTYLVITIGRSYVFKYTVSTIK